MCLNVQAPAYFIDTEYMYKVNMNEVHTVKPHY